MTSERQASATKETNGPDGDQPGGGELSGRAFAVEAARLAHDDKCDQVLVLDVTELSQLTDFIVIASGSSDRQMATALQHIMELAKENGLASFGRDNDKGSTWFLADFVDVVVHLFEPNARAHYDLEMLWGDADRVAWQRPDQIDRDRAGLGV